MNTGAGRFIPAAGKKFSGYHLRMELGRRHHQRLRQMYRSAGWPCQDVLEAELLAAGLLERVTSPTGHETLRVTDRGIDAISQGAARNRQALSAHEALVQQVAEALARAGRIVWRGLGLRAALAPESVPDRPPALDFLRSVAIENIANNGMEGADVAPATRWQLACPDVFSVRHTSVEAYLQPEVHEIKVSRADLLADLKRPTKRAAYLSMGGACWYVLGTDARGRPIASADEVPPECGVLQRQGDGLALLRPAPRRAVERLPFAVWMALARATPLRLEDEDGQAALAPDSE